MTNRPEAAKSADAYRTISEVADDLKLPQHVLRFWETRFAQIKPMKRGGNRRFYRPEDVDLLRAIKTLLYGDGLTIRGVQRMIQEQGPRQVAELVRAGRHRPAPPARLARPSDPGGGRDGRLAGLFGLGSKQEERMPDEGDPDDVSLPLPPDGAKRLQPAEPAYPEAASATGSPAQRLTAILDDLAECERILASVR